MTDRAIIPGKHADALACKAVARLATNDVTTTAEDNALADLIAFSRQFRAYVAPDDAGTPRREFLRTVATRIIDDLDASNG